MADNIIGNMFGVDPDQLRMQRFQQAQQQNAQMAQLDPFQRASASMANVGAGAVMLGAQALGLKTPEEQRAEVRRSAMMGVDAAKPESLYAAAQKLQQVDPAGSAELVRAARQLEVEKSKLRLEEQQTSLAAAREVALSEENRKKGVRPVNIGNGMMQDYVVDAAGTVTNVPVGKPYRNPDVAKLEREKQMPAGAFKLQDDHLAAYSAADRMRADYSAFGDMIKQGKLNLGLIDNVGGRLAIKAGVAGEDAVNLQRFINSMEENRNSLLLLNKGTQTEGDAIRAMTQLVSNINDKKYVAARMKDLSEISDKAANRFKSRAENVTKQYKAEPIDFSLYKTEKSAYDVSQPSTQTTAPSKGAVRKYNPATGRIE